MTIIYGRARKNIGESEIVLINLIYVWLFVPVKYFERPDRAKLLFSAGRRENPDRPIRQPRRDVDPGMATRAVDHIVEDRGDPLATRIASHLR